MRVGSLSCDLNGGTYSIFSRKCGYVVVLAGQRQALESRHSFEYSEEEPTSFTYNDQYYANDIVSKSLGPDAIAGSVRIHVEKRDGGGITLDLRQQSLNVDDMLKGIKTYDTKSEQQIAQFCDEMPEQVPDNSAQANHVEQASTEPTAVPATCNGCINISPGVAAGMLVQKSEPVYPAIAKAARVSGTVVLTGTISTTGEVENLRVVSGPAMLQQAALDGVKNWRYRPYLVNNVPTAVETSINVIFKLGE